MATACSDDAVTSTSESPRPTPGTAAVTTPPPTTTTLATTIATTTTTTAPTTTTTDVIRTALISTLPDGPCLGLGEPPDYGAAEVTFQVARRLYAATPDGVNVRCLVELPGDQASVLFPPLLEWGEAADRLLVGEHAYLASGEVATGFETLLPIHWTKPTGTSVLAVEDNKLVKRKVETGAVTDVTFLARHDAAIYHPAGTEILSIGEDSDGNYGIFLASNTGGNVRHIVDGTGAVLTELAFLYDGFTLYFIAVHDDGVSHLHEWSFFTPDEVADDDGISELYETAGFLHGLQLSPWDFVWVANEACDVDGDAKLVLPDFLTLPASLEGVPAEAVGWLPDGRLAVNTFPVACDLPGDLWIVDFSFAADGRPTATLLYSGAEEAAATGRDIQVVGVANAATRSPSPEPPPPIGDINLEAEA